MASRQPPQNLRTLATGSTVTVGLLLVAIWSVHHLKSVSAGTPASSGIQILDVAPTTTPAVSDSLGLVDGRVVGRTESGPYASLARAVGIAVIDNELGAKSPTGRGIIFCHAEGAAGDYTPDLNSPDFAAMSLMPLSGPSKNNGHTQATSHIIYGTPGLAPGVSQVEFMTSLDFLGAGCLKTGSLDGPTAGKCRVLTNSWIGQGGSDLRGTENSLRRADYLVDHDNVIIVGGVNNKASTSVPALLASAYNVIAVGQEAGDSSGGFTRMEGEGRCKPDIVAPGALTSFTTPVVAAVCARLLEAADHLPAGEAAAATHSAVIRALLLAGADKPANWAPKAGKPLDEFLGAGTVRFDHSYRILVGGSQGPGTITKNAGWDYHTLPLGETAIYEFNLPHATGEVSIILGWNRRIRGALQDLLSGRTVWSDEPRLADFDLALVRVDGQGEMVGASASNVDNVEHLYFKSLPAGQYRLGVRRKDHLDELWDYALAWRVEGAGPTLAVAATQPH